MRFFPLMVPLACALLAAVAATLASTVPLLAPIEEPWNIVVASQVLGVAKWTFVAALAHALVFGLPLYFLLRLSRSIGIAACAIGGFLLGAVPLSALTLMISSGRYDASTGDTPTVVNGVRTAAGWIEFAQDAGILGLYGLAGGLTFWAAMRLAGQGMGKFHSLDLSPGINGARKWSIIFVAGLLTGVLLIAPGFVQDDSCHNLVRDGRTSFDPQVYAELELPAEDWQKLRQIFIDFGTAHSLSFRGDQQIRQGVTVWRELSLCNDSGVNFDLIDQSWATQMTPPVNLPRTMLSIFELKGGSGWSGLARELLMRIEQTWPRKTIFRGPRSEELSLEQALKGRP